jgi:hypothetical protein
VVDPSREKVLIVGLNFLQLDEGVLELEVKSSLLVLLSLEMCETRGERNNAWGVRSESRRV